MKRNADRLVPFATTTLAALSLAAGVEALAPRPACAQEAQVILTNPPGAGGPGAGGRVITFGNGLAGLPGTGKPTLATAPVSAMKPYFGLTNEQAAKIEELQKTTRVDFRTLLAEGLQIAPGDAEVGPDGNRTLRIRVDREKMEAARVKMRERTQKLREEQDKVIKEIELVLTPDQRPSVAPFLRDLELFRSAFLPAELIRALDLNGPQKRKLQNIVQAAKADRDQRVQKAVAEARQTGRFGGIGGVVGGWRSEVSEKVRATLTPDQRALVEKWEKERPAPAPGVRRFSFGG